VPSDESFVADPSSYLYVALNGALDGLSFLSPRERIKVRVKSRCLRPGEDLLTMPNVAAN
jgi:hypothetical protein